MQLKEFTDKFIRRNNHESIRPELEALMIEKHGNWNKAHRMIQALESKEAAWAHAYLHRREGDLDNASFWYFRAGRNQPDLTLDEEWLQIYGTLMGK